MNGFPLTITAPTEQPHGPIANRIVVIGPDGKRAYCNTVPEEQLANRLAEMLESDGSFGAGTKVIAERGRWEWVPFPKAVVQPADPYAGCSDEDLAFTGGE